jgi:hypothetical protein
MKYHASDQIQRIIRIQNEALMKVADANTQIKEADELTAELKEELGSQFVVGDASLKLEHRAIGFAPGNRDWLVNNPSVSVIR